MPREHLFCEHLVARQHQAARSTAGVALAHQFQKRDHVVVVRNDTGELLHQIEHDVRAPIADGVAQLRELVADTHHPHVMAEARQCRVDVILGDRLFLLGQRRKIAGNERLVRDEQYPVSPHNVYFSWLRRSTSSTTRS